ncbi:hypothetical protein [Aureimonas fodinaquatilis]|nr:hypothetical protein [Aureimonas fodinaquatilis]
MQFHREQQLECEKTGQSLVPAIQAIDALLSAQAQFAETIQNLPAPLLHAIGATTEAAPEPSRLEVLEDAPRPVKSVDQYQSNPELITAPAKPALTEPATDNDVLLIMRANRSSDGLCLLRPSQIAKELGMHVGALNVGSLRRLAATGHIKNLGAGRFLVHDKLQPEVQAPEPEPEQPAIAVPVDKPDLTPAAQAKANRILAVFEKERTGLISSVERERLYRLAGSAHLLKKITKDMEARGIFRMARNQGGEAKDFISVVFPRATEAAE